MPQVLLVAELEELQANPARSARGTVLVRASGCALAMPVPGCVSTRPPWVCGPQ